MTYEELEAAIDADKNITLVNLKDGGYVSKDKFDAKETELKGVQTQLATANETIKGFEGQDVEGIKRRSPNGKRSTTRTPSSLKTNLKNRRGPTRKNCSFPAISLRAKQLVTEFLLNFGKKGSRSRTVLFLEARSSCRPSWKMRTSRAHL